MKPTLTRLTISASVVAMVLTIAVGGCNSLGCIDNQSALPLAGFYDYSTLSTKTLQTVEIGAIGAPNDSLLLESNEAASTLYMPFNLDADETKFYIRYLGSGLDDPSMFDTLRFVYDRVPYFASDDCGVMYKYVIKEFTATRHRIDSVALPYSTITQLDVEAIQIFFADLTPVTITDDDDSDNEITDSNEEN